MKIATSQFGEIEFSEDSLIYFPKGTIGFEGCRRFLLIENDSYQPFRGLMSVDKQQVGFPVLNPFIVNSDFGKKLPSGLLKRLLAADERIDIFCVVNLNREGGRATINLKSPIVIDHQRKRGEQIVLDSEELPVALPIF